MDDYESLHQRALARMLPLRPRYKSRRTSSQSQCPLFAILPPEIRRLIWIECLGGLVLPLSFPVHYRCDRICIHGALARIRLYCNPQCHSPVKTRIERSLLPILLTCQRIYSEAINILYSCNIFGFPNTNYLIVLPKLLISPHFNAIRSLNFTMRLEKVCPIYTDLYPSDRGDQLIRLWASQWKNIASMEGLRELRVRMKVPFRWRGVWIREQILLLEPLKQITKLKVFVLTLPFQDPAENESALQKLPCQVERARIGTYG